MGAASASEHPAPVPTATQGEGAGAAVDSPVAETEGTVPRDAPAEVAVVVVAPGHAAGAAQGHTTQLLEPSEHDAKYSQAEVDVMVRRACMEAVAACQAEQEQLIKAKAEEEMVAMTTRWRQDLNVSEAGMDAKGGGATSWKGLRS